MKISVTKEQQRAVEKAKEEYTLDRVLSHKGKGRVFGYAIDEINNATYEQIAAAWLGVAEVEPEYVSFEEAMKALKEGKRICSHLYREGENLNQPTFHKMDGLYGNVQIGYGEIQFGKWTIEEDSK